MPIIDVRDSFGGGSGDMAGRAPEHGRAEYSWQYLAPAVGAIFNEMGGHVEMTASDPEGEFTYCGVGAPRTPNYRVWADCQGLSTFAIVGVIARAVDASNLYRFYRTRTGTWSLDKIQGGGVFPLSSAGGLGNADWAGTLELEVVGSRIRGFLDGVQVTEATDTTFPNTGKPGITGVVSGGTVRVFGFEVIDLVNPIRMVG